MPRQERSGGVVDPTRIFSERVYGTPPEQVVGSTGKLKLRDGEPVFVKLPERNCIDDKEGKLIPIQTHIGHRPKASFGNSDGDIQMLQWATARSGAKFGLLVHHTDAEREWAYDRASSVGKLDRGLGDAQANGWTLVDMKTDWKVVVFPIEKKQEYDGH
jgi:hypothetical protein